MRVFNRPGILLNPFSVQNSHRLAEVFGRVLTLQDTNSCALEDELGAIAYAFHQVGDVVHGGQLFGALESNYTLVQQEETISKCLECATPDILRRATIRSRRFFDQSVLGEKRKKGVESKHSDEEVAEILMDSASLMEAEKKLGYGTGALSVRIRRASSESPLAVFAGAFKRGRQPKHSDKELAKVLASSATISEAARTLGMSHSTISYRIKTASEDSVLSIFQGEFKIGLEPEHTDEKIAEVLAKSASLMEAEKILGYGTGALSARIRRASSESPLAVFVGAFKRGSQPKHSDKELAKVLAKSTTISEAARSLGMSQSTISYRIRTASEESVLAKFQGVFKAGPILEHSDEELAEVLANSASLTEAEQKLGYGTGAVSSRIRRASSESPLAVFVGAFERGRQPKHSDKEIAKVLAKSTTISEAARSLGMSHSTISYRIITASEASVLYIFQGVFKPGPNLEYTDEELAEVLANSASITEAEQKLGYGKGAVSSRIRRASSESPLAVFRGAFKSGSQPKHSDKEIAKVLAKSTTMSEAARSLGMSHSTISYRIGTASEDSFLSIFQGVFKAGP
jgi:DNA-binding transcriptional LysR family regulator